MNPLPTNTVDEMFRFVYSAVQLAGKESLKYFRTSLNVNNKAAAGKFDPVTEADKAVERRLRELIEERFPEHAILGEEFDPLVGREGNHFRWLIDPIDGTRSFISGVPAWGVLLALVYKDQPLLGVMHQPYLNETFVGLLQHNEPQAWFFREQLVLDQPLAVSRVDSLEQAILFSTHPEIFEHIPGGFERYQAVARRCKLMRYGGDCYCYCLLAMGQVDLVIEADLQDYDILPLVPIVEAAGGVISTWDGAPVRAGGQVIAAATPELHKQALSLLNERQ
ncbi:MAG: inositol monophosphatase family protein [Pseudomonadota bacterium]